MINLFPRSAWERKTATLSVAKRKLPQSGSQVSSHAEHGNETLRVGTR